jgi:putative sterol carrier protein
MATGMMNLPKAPADITPAKFFGEWLPTQVEAFKDMIGSLGGETSAAMSFRITGQGGGDWSTLLAGGKVKVEKGLRDDALVTVVMNATNFVEAVTGQLEEVMQPPPGAAANLTPAQAAAKAKENMEAVKSIIGAVGFSIEDDKKPFAAMVKFAGPLKDAADVTVSMERQTAVAIAKGDTNPQAAFMSGQVKIEGDLSILMMLMPLMQ